MAGWVTIVGSVFMLVNVYTYVSQLRTLDNRESVADALKRDPLKGMGLDLEQALSLLHSTSLVAGACAAATAILGAFVLQRNHHARIGLSVLIVPLFFSGLVASPFLSSMIAVSVVLLWGKPSRDWFNGVTPQQPERQERAPVHQHVGPRSFEGFGKSPSTGTGTGTGTGAEAQPAQPEGSTQQGTQPGPARPAAVVQACITTWVASAIVLVAMVVVVVGTERPRARTRPAVRSMSATIRYDVDG